MPVKLHYWLAFFVVMIAVAVIGMWGWTEKAFRLTGMFLQLGGVLTVVWGIWKTRADFGLPTVRSQFQSWFKTFLRLNPPSIELPVSSLVDGQFGEARITTSGPSADQTVEGRLGHLESIVKKQEVAQEKTNVAVSEVEKKVRQELAAQAREVGRQIDGVLKKIETTATSGIHISAMGAILLFVGTIFGGAAPELSYLLMPKACESILHSFQ